MRLLCELLRPPVEFVRQRMHRSYSSRVSTTADFPRHIDQRNNDGNCADDLADCTNRFPIHGMIHVIASDIQSQRAGILEGQSSARWQEDAASWQVRSSGSGSWIYLTG